MLMLDVPTIATEPFAAGIQTTAAGLSLRGVSHVYGGSPPTEALRNIDLDVRPGEFVAVVGASGCGKSTLLRIASGLAAPSSGTAMFGGELLAGPNAHISMIFQDAVMLPWFTVLDNVTLPKRIARHNLSEARDDARTMLTSVGLGGFEDAYPDKLSGGMRQRAAIVRALMTKPRLLLMDEPFGALDAMTRENMNFLLSEITTRTGCSVLLITHSIAEAVLLADRVVVMTPRPGEIAEEIEIPLPRPRSRETMLRPEFAHLSDRLRRHFSADGHVID